MNETIHIKPSRLQRAMLRHINNSRMTVEQKREVQTQFTSKIAEEAKYCEVSVFHDEMIEVVAKELIDCINEDNSKFADVSFCEKLIEDELMAKYLLDDAVRAVENIVNVINGHDYRVINIDAVVNGVWKAFTPMSHVIQTAC